MMIVKNEINKISEKMSFKKLINAENALEAVKIFQKRYPFDIKSVEAFNYNAFFKHDKKRKFYNTTCNWIITI